MNLNLWGQDTTQAKLPAGALDDDINKFEEGKHFQSNPAYTINPDDPNYVANSASTQRDIGMQAAGDLTNLSKNAYNFSQGAASALVGKGNEATQFGLDAATNIAGRGANASSAIAGQGQQAQSAIQSRGQTAQDSITQYGSRMGAALDATGKQALSGITSVANQGAGDIAAAGQGAQQQLASYGTDQGAMLGRLGMQAGQTAGAQGQAITAGTAQQGQALAQQGAAIGQGVTDRALAQSGAIGGFAGQQGAAGAAAAARQFNDPNFAAANSLYGTAGANAGSLAALEAAEGPSAAQAQLQTGLNAAQASNLALARSGRGWGGSASALSEAAVENARAGQQAANQAAILRAQETSAHRQRQAANLGAAAGLQTGLGGALGGQTQFGSDLALRQQALTDQTALGYGSQALQGMTAAGDLALRGGLGAGELALQGSQAGADLALRGALGGGQLGLSGAQLQGQLAGQGAALGMQGLESGAGFATQAARDAAAMKLQGIQSGYGMSLDATQAGAALGLEGLTSGYGMGLDALTSGAEIGQQGLVNAANVDLASMQAAANAGFQGFGMGIDATGQAANAGMQGIGMAGGLVGQAGQMGMAGEQAAFNTYLAETNLSGNAMEDALTKYGIDKGVAVQQRAQDQQMLGAGLSAFGAALPFIAAASDAAGKKDIIPIDSVRALPGGPGGAGYDAAMGSAARARKIYGAEEEANRNLIEINKPSPFADGLGGSVQAFGRSLMATPQPQMMFNPYGARYLSSDVNSKTEIAQLRGQVQALGGQAPPSAALGQAATQQASAFGAQAIPGQAVPQGAGNAMAMMSPPGANQGAATSFAGNQFAAQGTGSALAPPTGAAVAAATPGASGNTSMLGSFGQGSGMPSGNALAGIPSGTTFSQSAGAPSTYAENQFATQRMGAAPSTPATTTLGAFGRGSATPAAGNALAGAAQQQPTAPPTATGGMLDQFRQSGRNVGGALAGIPAGTTFTGGQPGDMRSAAFASQAIGTPSAATAPPAARSAGLGTPPSFGQGGHPATGNALAGTPAGGTSDMQNAGFASQAIGAPGAAPSPSMTARATATPAPGGQSASDMRGAAFASQAAGSGPQSMRPASAGSGTYQGSTFSAAAPGGQSATPQNLMGNGAQPVGSGMRDNMRANLALSDVRSKTRIAELEDHVSLLGGNPAASPRMELGYDPRAGVAGIYRPQGSVIGEGPVDPAYARAAAGDGRRLDFAWDPESGIYRDSALPPVASVYDREALDAASRRAGLEPVAPSPRAAARAIDAAPGFAYEYRDPNAPGAAPGRHFGPMAGDLARTPVGRSTLVEMPDGRKGVDTGRLSLVNTAAIHGMQSELDTALARLAELEQQPAPKKKAPRPPKGVSPAARYDLAALDAAAAREAAYQGGPY